MVNPFAVQTPESMTAQEVVDLFEPVPDVDAINRPGHTFIHGQRGSGKSMLLRWMSPECVMLARQVEETGLPYLSVYLSIKQAQLDLPELKRIEGQSSGAILSEHLLACLLIVKTLETWRFVYKKQIAQDVANIWFKSAMSSRIIPRLKACGWKPTEPLPNFSNTDEIITWLKDLVDLIHVETVCGYVQRLAVQTEPLRWSGPLLGYQTILLPLIKELKGIPGVPSGTPVFMLIDDADNLNFDQTSVLNSWVAQRTTEVVSLKISTQMRYKTYLTHGNTRIETPHDFSEIFLSSVLVGSGPDTYESWLTSILKKRLVGHSETEIDLNAFFPEDSGQIAGIRNIAEEIREGAEREGPRGNRVNDDVYRYARPEYMRKLGGASKGSSRYSYSGYRQLVHISSGVVRFFLDPAARMYSEQMKRNAGAAVRCIDPDIQNNILRETGNALIFQELDKLRQDAGISAWIKHAGDLTTAIKKLKNLVEAFGAVFRMALVDSDRSERRIFSVLLNDEPTEEVGEVIKLGVILGYFQEASIGAKDGLGRTRRIVLTRRLAPYFNLDPIGFSGYLSVTQEFLEKAVIDPKSIRGRLKNKGIDTFTQQQQLGFDFEGGRI